MVSKGEDFFLEVRRAARLAQKPTVGIGPVLFGLGTATMELQRAARWLTPNVVATYDPAAFEAWPENLQLELSSAVEEYRSVAGTVQPDKPATEQQLREGLQAFNRLTSAVQQGVWADWEEAARELIKRVEEWAAEFQWVTRREEKKLNEMLIGAYSLDQLFLHAEGNLYILDPVARFVPGALGAFDLSIQPSFYVTSIYRNTGGVWYIHPHIGEGGKGEKKKRLTKETFKRALEELRSLL